MAPFPGQARVCVCIPSFLLYLYLSLYERDNGVTEHKWGREDEEVAAEQWMIY